MESLTKSEEQIMKHLWKLERAFMKDIVDQYPKPKPAYTTIATILTRMVEKELVGFDQHGKVREYYPKLKKAAYFKNHVKELIDNFFESPAQFASFFTTRTDLSVKQLEELKKLVETEIKQKKQ